MPVILGKTANKVYVYWHIAVLGRSQADDMLCKLQWCISSGSMSSHVLADVTLSEVV